MGGERKGREWTDDDGEEGTDEEGVLAKEGLGEEREEGTTSG